MRTPFPKPAALAIALLMVLTVPALARADMGAAVHAGTPAPTFGQLITVPSTVAISHVYGTVSVTGSAIDTGRVDINRCGANDFATFISPLGASELFFFSFPATGGDCYRFSNTRDPTAGNLIVFFRTVNVTLESFEGRAHANVTRAEMNATLEGRAHANATRSEINASVALKCDRGPAPEACAGNGYANATWEGQAHANATWCPLPCAGGSGDFVGNQWFNDTWRWNPILGNVTALRLNVGFANVTDFEILSNVTISTAWDGYRPLVVYFGLLLLFGWLNAIFPMMIAFLAFGNAILPTPVWPEVASYMLLGIAVLLHALLARWPDTWKRWMAGNPDGDKQ